MVSDFNSQDDNEYVVLPVNVRETLMRGDHESAVELLALEHSVTKEQAEKVIVDYKADLKERNALLEIQVMQDKMLKESKQDIDNIWVWGSRLLILVVVFALLYVLTLGLSNKS